MYTEKVLYHVSPTGGLTQLRPSLSSHGRPYVYAIEYLAAALIFGAKKDDFDLLMDVEEGGVTTLWECYPEAFAHIYAGKSCYVYEVPAAPFQKGLTGWDPE